MKKLWKIYGEEPKQNENPEVILNDYAKQVYEDTNKQFIGLVTETVKEDSDELSLALYILVPQLRDYMYRLIEVSIQNVVKPYPLELKLFAKEPRNHRAFSCNDAADYKKKLEEAIESPITGAILMHLKTLIGIRGKLREGQAGIATLTTGEKINFGVQKIEGDEVLYYTGKGLRTMWKPNMNEEEQKEAESLKKQSEEWLIENQYMEKKRISDFQDIK